MNKTSVLVLALMISGCSAALVPLSFDPQTKLNQAKVLYQEQNRPLPADDLIHEAMAIYRERGDELGLAEANKAYAYFLQSPTVERRYGPGAKFDDKSVTYENRYEKAREYFLKARETFEKHAKYDSLTNIDLHLGHHYNFLNDPATACVYYKKAIEDNRKHMEMHPNDTIALPKGFRSFADYMAKVKEKTPGCK